MKSIFKKIICLCLILSMSLSICTFSFATTIDYDKLDTDLETYKSIVNFVNAFYLYDIPHNDVVNSLYSNVLSLMRSKTDNKELLNNDEFSFDIEVLKQVVKLVSLDKNMNITEQELMQCLYKSFFDVLDPYSTYFTKDEYSKFTVDLAGEFAGIGTYLSLTDGKFIITGTIPDTPAEKAGIKPDDIIISVDNKSVENLSLNDLATLLRGEAGSTVNVGIDRKGTKLYFKMTRQKIETVSAAAKILDNNIGYLQIAEFNANTYDQVVEKLKYFDTNNVKDLIIDIRNNPGGSLDCVVKILGEFVEKGPLVYVNNSFGGNQVYVSELEKQKYNISVLVNEYSASASEIFAGAIQDRKSGTIIGTTTYGKGVVQALINLQNGEGMKLTVSEYFTPNKNKVQGVGIKPDIEVKQASSIDLSDYPKFKKNKKPGLNAVGLDVLAAEMILQTIGYKVNEPDGILDKTTFAAIKEFQNDCNSYSYGILDYSTQDALTNALNLYAQNNQEDMQLKKAIELFTK